jgi:hypothetical protein
MKGRKMKRSKLAMLTPGFLLVAGLMIGLTTTASATAITTSGGGILAIGNLQGTLVGVSQTCINWGYPAACQTTTGIADSVSGIDPFFLLGPGTIKDLPLGVALPLVDFQTVQSTLGLVHFDMTSFIAPVVAGVNNCTTFALGAECAPAGSPFLLKQSDTNQVGITMNLNEIAYLNTSTTGSTPYKAIFTTQISGVIPGTTIVATIPNILAYLGASASNNITATWSATESPQPIPEPGQLLIMGSGLIGLALLKRRKARS